MHIPSELEQQISTHSGRVFNTRHTQRIGGGCINSAYMISDGTKNYFVKFNQPERASMFEAEKAGLEALSAPGCIGVPQSICVGHNRQFAWIVLEYIKLGHSGPSSFSRAGHDLACIHQTTASQFGWHRQNTIGLTEQHNDPADTWSEFWQQHRLGLQMKLAIRHGFSGEVIEVTESVIEKCEHLLTHQPSPSLLHGDLWSGNLSFDEAGKPFIFDPAVYYGDAEADLAMTELFGGFNHEFYTAYAAVRPIAAGYQVRKTLYNLYHILNHMNLFGGSYQNQAISMSKKLLSEVK